MVLYIIICTLLSIPMYVLSSPDECCVINEADLTCVGCIPMIVPQNVSAVLIRRVSFAEYATMPPFNSSTWSHVTHLTIRPDEGYKELEYVELPRYTLRSKSFYHMRDLRVLKFASINLVHMHKAVFDGLVSVREIDLSDCINIGIESITTGLTGSNIPELQALNLRGVYRLAVSVGFFDNKFFDFLKTTKIEILDLSDTEKNLMDLYSFSNSMPYLRTLNLENGGHLAVNFMLAIKMRGNGPTFKNLKHINLNYPKIQEIALTAANIQDLQSAYRFHLNFTDIRMRGCIPKDYSASVIAVRDSTNSSISVTIDFTNKDISWTVFRLISDYRGLSYLETLDIGENGIESIDSTIAKALGGLRHLNISHNLLYKMNAKYLESLLWQVPLLESLNCSYNKLILIPKSFFISCFNLKFIDISHNNLEHIDFDMSHLTGLRLFDASYNRIHTLGDITTDTFSKMISNVRGFKLFIEENPFECSCPNKYFIVWLVKNKLRMNTSYTCYVDDNRDTLIVVDQGAVRTIDQLCVLPMIYITSSVSSAVLLSCLVILTICCVRKYRTKQARLRLEKVIEMHRLNKTNEKIPVFLSYCSSDEDMVGAHILPMFNKKLQTLLRTDKQCVCTGDISFTPGFHISEEIIKCIETSCVILACVSNKFCKSFFCKDEIMAAYQGSKPIILLFLEDVDIKQLPKAIQTHFNTITRAKVQVDNGNELVFTPEVDLICEALVKLMQPTYNDT